MDIKDVKRFNLALLAAQSGGRMALAERLGYSDVNHFNQMCGGFTGIGRGVTEKIYSAVKLPALWLETAHVDEWVELGDKSFIKWRQKNPLALEAHVTHPASDSVTTVTDSVIPDENSKLPSGNVQHSLDFSERNQGHIYVQSYELWAGQVESEIRFMSIPEQWLNEKGLSSDQVKSIEMPDDSAADRILEGDLVAINTAWGGELKNNEVYAVRIDGRYTLRRVQVQASGSVVLKCRNPRYTDDVVSKADIGALDVLGAFARFQGVSA